jgi:hypothetical protein
MARRKKTEVIDPEERARLKKLRAIQRREERKKRRAEGGTSQKEPKQTFNGIETSHPQMVRDNFDWIKRSMAVGYAWKIVNSDRERPYWLSIKFEGGNPPVSHFYPCNIFRRGNRYYYGFLFQHCRDETFKKWRKEYGAKKHFTGPDDRPLT